MEWRLTNVAKLFLRTSGKSSKTGYILPVFEDEDMRVW
ncbi:hypothetical protein AEAC466_09155 [Asticcacaulis sp. AC466]|nr:hypothetical protein AEAC466_09155 [Asticcacaulis sp. AC466]